MNIHDPENKQKVDCIWMFLSRDEKGNEGILAMPVADGLQFPMLTGDEKLMQKLKPMARMLKQKTQKQIVLVKFSNKEDVETL